MEEQMLHGYAAAAFGLEGLVAAELRGLRFRDVRAENGGVHFAGTMADVFTANLSLRTCDRVFLLLKEAEGCKTYEDLFQAVSGLPWEAWMKGDEAINISCKCVRSQLMSPRDCQSVAKKAVIERLKKRTGRRVFPESGAAFPVQLSLRADQLRILLNTSGTALNRRGYRTWNGEAPLRETLAAALVTLSPWKPGRPLIDPCCGTGTILIEAAMMASGRLPGLKRSFAMESFAFWDPARGDAIRKEAEADVHPERIAGISGSDLDPAALELARRHLRQADLGGLISLSECPLQELKSELENGVFICNPPYGERLSDRNTCHRLYHDLAELRRRHPGWSLCAISSDPAFERAYGQRADRKRRLYNGRLECVYYIYD